jgi:hypothetical protein
MPDFFDRLLARTGTQDPQRFAALTGAVPVRPRVPGRYERATLSTVDEETPAPQRLAAVRAASTEQPRPPAPPAPRPVAAPTAPAAVTAYVERQAGADRDIIPPVAIPSTVEREPAPAASGWRETEAIRHVPVVAKDPFETSPPVQPAGPVVVAGPLLVSPPVPPVPAVPPAVPAAGPATADRRPAASPPREPSVHVRIGRIEVHAAEPPPPPPAPRRRPAPALSLSRYLAGERASDGGGPA